MTIKKHLEISGSVDGKDGTFYVPYSEVSAFFVMKSSAPSIPSQTFVMLKSGKSISTSTGYEGVKKAFPEYFAWVEKQG